MIGEVYAEHTVFWIERQNGPGEPWIFVRSVPWPRENALVALAAERNARRAFRYRIVKATTRYEEAS